MTKLNTVLSIFLELDIWRPPFEWTNQMDIEESDWDRLEGAAQDLLGKLDELGVEGLPEVSELLEAFKQEVRGWGY